MGHINMCDNFEEAHRTAMYAAIGFLICGKLDFKGCMIYKSVSGRLSMKQLDNSKIRLTITNHVETLIKDTNIDEFDYVLSDIIDFDKLYNTKLFIQDDIDCYYKHGGIGSILNITISNILHGGRNV